MLREFHKPAECIGECEDTLVLAIIIEWLAVGNRPVAREFVRGSLAVIGGRRPHRSRSLSRQGVKP